MKIKASECDINEIIDDISEDFDVFSMDYEARYGCKNIDEKKINEVKKSLNLILNIVKRNHPDAKIEYSTEYNSKDISLNIIITTDSGDWFESDSKTFINCVQYASEFKISPMDNEQMEIIFLFNDFIHA